MPPERRSLVGQKLLGFAARGLGHAAALTGGEDDAPAFIMHAHLADNRMGRELALPPHDKRSRTISRVLYHSALAGGMATVIPLGAQLPVPSSNLPGSVDRADPLPYLVLLRTGLAELVTSPCRLVGSYPTVSPLPPKGGGLFSVALSEDHPSWALPSVLPCEARTFLSVRHAETRRTRRQSIRLPKT